MDFMGLPALAEPFPGGLPGNPQWFGDPGPAYIPRAQGIDGAGEVFAVVIGGGVERLQGIQQPVRWPVARVELGWRHLAAAHDQLAGFDALIADVKAAGTGCQFGDLFVGFSAERTIDPSHLVIPVKLVLTVR